jgi:hypothetical protein
LVESSKTIFVTGPGVTGICWSGSLMIVPATDPTSTTRTESPVATYERYVSVLTSGPIAIDVAG